MQAVIAHTVRGPMEYRLEGAGPVVMVLNGGHCSRESRLSHETLSGCGFTVLTPSRPGYDATPAATGRTAQAAADALATLLDELGLTALRAVIGISAAGPTALALARQHPQRLEKLILESALTLPWNAADQRRGRRLFGRAAPITWGVTRWLLRLFPNWTTRTMLRELTTRDVHEALGRLSPLDLRFIREMIAASQPAEGFLLDLEHRIDELAGISHPVLVMYSPYDKPVPPENALRIQRELPQAELFAADADTHLIWIGPGALAVWDRRLEFLRRET